MISHLLDAFRLTTPHRTIECPQWDVCTVLTFLRDKCEPLATLSLKILTFKTLFLIALATARRVSGIHAICGLAKDIAFTEQDASVTLRFLPEFWAKNQPSASKPLLLVVPGLSHRLCDDDSDIALCPVRSLRTYLDRTTTHRLNKRRLFISLNKRYNQDIAKGTISRWIKSTIKLAFSQTKTPLHTNTVRAHEVRAIATSLAFSRGASLVDILRSAYWRSTTTFVSFYLRDVSSQRADGSAGFNHLVTAGHSF